MAKQQKAPITFGTGELMFNKNQFQPPVPSCPSRPHSSGLSPAPDICEVHSHAFDVDSSSFCLSCSPASRLLCDENNWLSSGLASPQATPVTPPTVEPRSSLVVVANVCLQARCISTTSVTTIESPICSRYVPRF